MFATEHGSFAIRPISDGHHVLRKLSSSASGLSCEAFSPEDVGPSGSPGEIAEVPLGPEGAGCDDGTRHDAIVLYTPAARVAAAPPNEPNNHAYIRQEIILAIADMNSALENSAVTPRVKLLYTGEINYQETGSEQTGQYLVWLKQQWDRIMDEAHGYRNALRADLVSVVASQGTAGSVAFVMGPPESPSFEASAFSAVLRTWVAPFKALAHELGHNLGCHHDTQTACGTACEPCGGGLLPDSHGHHSAFTHVPVGAGFLNRYTIMAYSLGFAELMPHYSNPNVSFCIPGATPECLPTGSSLQDCGKNNANTIDVSADTASQLRISSDTTNSTFIATRNALPVSQANNTSASPSISHNGQYTVFETLATNLTTTDVNGTWDVFTFNRESGLIELASARNGSFVAANGASRAPALSGDGHFVAIESEAEDLVLPVVDTNDVSDAYVIDRGLRLAVRVSVRDPSVIGQGQTNEADNASYRPAISRDGRFVAFESLATNLVANDVNGQRDIFIRDRNMIDDATYDQPNDV